MDRIKAILKALFGAFIAFVLAKITGFFKKWLFWGICVGFVLFVTVCLLLWYLVATR